MKIKGFTLIETIVYIGLFGILMSGGVVAVYALLTSIHENRSEITRHIEAQFVNNKLSWALAGAASVVVVETTTLAIEREDLGVASPLQFSVTESQFFLKRGTGPNVPLSAKKTIVSDVRMSAVDMPLYHRTEVSIYYRLDGVPFQYRTYIPMSI